MKTMKVMLMLLLVMGLQAKAADGSREKNCAWILEVKSNSYICVNEMGKDVTAELEAEGATPEQTNCNEGRRGLIKDSDGVITYTCVRN